MQMTLNNFEGLVEKKIVDRGYDYYQRGRVAKVERIGEVEFSAVAFGSDDYDLYVKIDGERIVEYECDCPYDWGNTCKHVVPLFYQIKYGNFTNTSDKFREILDNLTDETLRNFVLNLLKRDRHFRRKFLREFDEDFEEDEFEDEFDEDYY